MDRVDRLYERARVLAESGADVDSATAELLRMAGDRWVVEAALGRAEALAARVPRDAPGQRAVDVLRSVLALDVLR